jgi:hypothetical protein
MLNSSFSQKLRYNDNFPGSRFSTHKKTPLLPTATVQRELKEGKKQPNKKNPTEKDYGRSFGLKYTKADDAPEREKTTRKIPSSEQARQRAEQRRLEEEDDTSDNANAKGERNTVSMVHTIQNIHTEK